MTLAADLLVRRGDFTLDVNVRVEAGETLALLGPNGSGKSTMLAAIAGLLTPERGTVEVNGQQLTRTGAGAGTNVGAGTGTNAGAGTSESQRFVEPHARGVGLLGQDPLLFPHFTARENVAFGLRAKGVSASRARAAADTWMEDVGLAGLADRRPGQLSGGQQQRVAIARALAAEPRALLLDEPMAALDVESAAAVRTLLRERLASAALPVIVVTHDVVDAMVLADRVAILDDGRIVDIGEPAIVLGQPRNSFAAKLVGLNIVEGVLDRDGSVRCADGRRVRGRPGMTGIPEVPGMPEVPGILGFAGVDGLPAASGRESIAGGEITAGDAVTAVFPPSAIRVSTALSPDEPGPSMRDGYSWSTTVASLDPTVGGIRIPFVGDSLTAEMTPAQLLASGVREGMRVTVTVNPDHVTVYPTRRASDAGASVPNNARIEV